MIKMKNIFLFIVVLLSFQFSSSQTYYAFPQDTAVWNSLFFWNGSPNPADYWVQNFNFKLVGDTILKGKNYNKSFYNDDYTTSYCGGLREDSLKQIFFFPFSTYFYFCHFSALLSFVLRLQFRATALAMPVKCLFICRPF